MPYELAPRSPNPFAYPAGIKFGFDPSHIAIIPQSTSLMLSAVAMLGGNFVSTRGAVGTLTGSTSALKPAIGPVSIQSTTGDKVVFTVPATVFKTVTLAAIVIPATVGGGARGIIETGSTGWRININGSAFRLTLGGIADITSGLTLAANVPYFLAVSADTVTANFVVTDLSTGKISSAAVASATATTTTDATLKIGNDSSFELFTGSIACVMAAVGTGTTGRMSLPALKAWAADPWAFWYPRRTTDSVGAAAAGGGFPWWAVQNNLPVIGAGTY